MFGVCPGASKLNLTGYHKFVRRVYADSEVVIEDNIWIAAGVIIGPGVRIGKNSVVGAGSVVIRGIPLNSFAAGCPAKVIKKLWE